MADGRRHHAGLRRRRLGALRRHSDWTQARDLSKENPDKLHELQRLWLIEAVKYNVLPLDDRGIERLIPELAGRPTLIQGIRSCSSPGMGRLSENSVVNIKNKSFSVTADIEVPEGGAEGMIIAQGGRFGGWSVYLREGKAKFVYNVLGINEFATGRHRPDPVRETSGPRGIRIRWRRPGKGGNVTLYYDGDPVGSGRVEFTQADDLLRRRDDRRRLRERDHGH